MDEPKATDPTNPRNPIAAPLGTSGTARVWFTNGAHRITIRADSHVRGLYRARFGSRVPMVGVRGRVVTIRYPRVPPCDWLGCRSERLAEVALNARISWDVEVRGGASRLLAGLRGLRLGSLGLDGGASRLEVELPASSGTVAVVILGGASNVAIHRPEGVAARLRVDGGATNLVFDDRRIGAAGGELDLHSRDYDGATDRYDIAVTGGANNLSIDKRRGGKGRGSGGRRENRTREPGRLLKHQDETEGADLDRKGE
jgi:hypothetical protein